MCNIRACPHRVTISSDRVLTVNITFIEKFIGKMCPSLITERHIYCKVHEGAIESMNAADLMQGKIKCDRAKTYPLYLTSVFYEIFT